MPKLSINEVAPRDGLQMEADFLPTSQKIQLIDRLSNTGLSRIEVTSFVSPKAIPNLADAEDVVRGIRRSSDVGITVLVPNIRGAERAIECHVDEINLVMSASTSHSLANLRMTPAESLAQFADIVKLAHESKIFVNGSLSTSFGCPFEGEVPEAQIVTLVYRMLEKGVDGITLCDTTGVANPAQVTRICELVLSRFADIPFTLHFHNTRGMGLANALAAWQTGITQFDASLGGLGGCPFAPGATGNVCTEDLVHMFEQMGVPTGVDLDSLLAVSATLPDILKHDTPGQVVKAGKADRRYPMPAR